MSRRRIAKIAGLVGAEFAVLGLQQLGVIKRLPDIPIRPFDANSVMRARVAYPFGIPDTTLATAGCSIMAALASAPKRSKLVDIALGAGAAIGAGAAAFYLGHMTFVQRKICIYCVAAATGLFSLVPLVYREVMR